MAAALGWQVGEIHSSGRKLPIMRLLGLLEQIDHLVDSMRRFGGEVGDDPRGAIVVAEFEATLYGRRQTGPDDRVALLLVHPAVDAV